MMGLRGRRAAGAGVALLGLGLVASACGSEGDGAAPTTTVGTTTIVEHPDWSLDPTALVEVPDAPYANANAGVTWTPVGFLVAGRWEDPGAAATPAQLFDVETGSWSVLPPDPIDDPILYETVAPTPDGFVVYGSRCTTNQEIPGESSSTRCRPGDEVAVRFELPASTWRVLELPSDAPGDQVDIGGPRPSVRWRRDGSVHLVSSEAGWSTYDPTADAWQAIEAPPVGLQPCLADDATVAVGRDPETGLDASEGPMIAARLELDGRWTDLPASPVGPTLVSASPCTASSVLVFSLGPSGGDPEIVELDAVAGTWRPIDPPPRPLGYPIAAPIDGGAVFFDPAAGAAEGPLSVQRWDVEAATWQEVPVEPFAPAGADPRVWAVSPDGVYLGRVGLDDGPGPSRRLAVDLVP